MWQIQYPLNPLRLSHTRFTCQCYQWFDATVLYVQLSGFPLPELGINLYTQFGTLIAGRLLVVFGPEI